MKYQESLRKLGLKNQEAEIYLACLKLGKSKISELAKEVDIPRTSIYIYVKNLLNKGYLKKAKKDTVEYFSAINPSVIQEEWQRKIDSFGTMVPSLEKMLDIKNKRSSVEYFDTAEGLRKLYETMLVMKYKTPAFLIESEEALADSLEKLGNDFNHRWQKKFLEKGVITQGIITEKMLEIFNNIPKKTKEIAMQRPATVRVIDNQQFPFSINLYLLYPDLSFILVPQENFIVMIKNKNIYQSLSTFFHLLYTQGKPVSIDQLFSD
ncbi:MAG: helix-turn-helix domain-containing protein [bacterium]|nr:helix-turn-helix domain-containing protein [bacterium]